MTSGPSRRDFLKQALLASAVAVDLRATDRSPAVPASAERPSTPLGAGTPAATYPVYPYGNGPPIYLADLDRCEPASGIAADWSTRQWKRFSFASDKVTGVMLAAGTNTAAPDLEYRIGPRGWCAVYFGLKSVYAESRLQVRLKHESAFSLITHNDMAETGLGRPDIEFAMHDYTTKDFDDLFWRCVNFEEGRDTLVLRQLKVQVLPGDPEAVGNRFMPCWLGYIKLVPLSQAEIAQLEADRARRDTRRLFGTCDAFGAPAYLHWKRPDDIRRELEPYRETDFSRMYWEAGMGDLAYFPSKIGRLFTLEWLKAPYRLYDRMVGESYRDMRAAGVDPFRVALDRCHEIGLEFHASYRVAGFYFPPPEDEWNTGGLYHRHPEWRAVSPEGVRQPRLSYAYPGVRQYVLSFFQEVVSTYPVDGICVLYNRRLPVLGHEADHPTDIMSGFMRDLRRLMRAEEKRQSRGPIGITAIVMGSEAENLGYGLDLRTWVKEGLIDTLVPYSSVAGISSDQRSWLDPSSAEFFLDLTKGTPCTLSLNLMPRQVPPEEYKRRAHALYEAGVDSLFFWDSYQRASYDRPWTALTRLGHKEELAGWAAQGSPKVQRPQSRLTRIGDWDLSFQTPG